MNPTETFPHRRDGLLQACRCGTSALCGIGATFGENCPAALREALGTERLARTRLELEVGVQETRAFTLEWDAETMRDDLSGRLRIAETEALFQQAMARSARAQVARLYRERERARDTGPHITPALLRRIEALGFVPGSGEPVGWLVTKMERMKADHTALLLGVGHPMWLPSVADAVDHPDQFNATPDEVLDRVRAAVAERDELAATLANERGEEEPPSALSLLASARDAFAASGNGFVSIFSADERWFAAITQVRDRRHAAALLRWRGGGGS